MIGDPINFVDPNGQSFQFSVGVSATAALSLFPFVSPFVGGGLSVSITSDGQFFATVQANAFAGPGWFWGVGVQGGFAVSCGPLVPGMSTQTSAYAEANAGYGASIGGSVSGNSAGGGVAANGPGRTGRIGAGYGIGGGVGGSTTTTFATPPLW